MRKPLALTLQLLMLVFGTLVLGSLQAVPRVARAVSPSGAILTFVPNGDFSGGTGGTVAGWTVTSGAASYNGSYVFIDPHSTIASAAFALDYPSNGNLAWFRIGHQFQKQLHPITISFGSSVVFGSSSDPADWVEHTFSVPSSAGSSGQLSISSGSGDDLLVAYVERLNTPTGRGTPRFGITADSRFPRPAAATSAGGIDLASGAYLYQHTDLALAGRSGYLPLSFSRAYSDQAISGGVSNGAVTTGPLGSKWTDNWQYSLQAVNPGQTVVVFTPGGPCAFNNNGSGTYVGQAGLNATLT
jgi:hypothetical protein